MDENVAEPQRSRSRSYTRSRSRSRKRSYSRSRSRSPRRRSRSRSPGRRRSPYYDSYNRGGGGSGGGGYSGYGRNYGYRRSRSRSPFSRRRRHLGDRDNPEPSRCIGVFGLSLNTVERDVYDVFQKYGRIEKVTVVYDRKTGRSRGFCFVYFNNMDDAMDAKETAQKIGMEIDGRPIRVDYSVTERAHTPTPGIYMGKPDTTRRRRSRTPSPYYGRGRRSYSRSYSRSPPPRRY